MTQKITIPQQNQPFRRQSSLGGNVSFREIGNNEDNTFITLAKVTKVYYKQGRIDFKLTNTNNVVLDVAGSNGEGSAPIPVDFFGRKADGTVFGHYRPIKMGDIVAIAYVGGHRSFPIVIGVYPDSSQDYEIISPSLYKDGDDNHAGIAEQGLADRKVYPSMQTDYRSGSGAIAKALNGHSFLVIDDNQVSKQYNKLWSNYKNCGFFTADGKYINPLKEKAGEWLLIHEDNPKAGEADDHRARFYVNRKGEMQIVFMSNTDRGNLLMIEGARDKGFTLTRYYGLDRKKSGQKDDQVYEPDLDNAHQYIKFNFGGKDQSAGIQATSKEDSVEQTTNFKIKDDGIYVNGKVLVSSSPNYTGKTLIDDAINNSEGLNDAIKEAHDAASAAKDAGDSAIDKAGQVHDEINDMKDKMATYLSESADNQSKNSSDPTKSNLWGKILNGVYLSGKTYAVHMIADVLDAGTLNGENMIFKNVKFNEGLGNHISANLIDTGTLNAVTIKAGSITANKLNAPELSDISKRLGKIEAGSITIGKIDQNGKPVDPTTKSSFNNKLTWENIYIRQDPKKYNSIPSNYWKDAASHTVTIRYNWSVNNYLKQPIAIQDDDLQVGIRVHLTTESGKDKDVDIPIDTRDFYDHMTKSDITAGAVDVPDDCTGGAVWGYANLKAGSVSLGGIGLSYNSPGYDNFKDAFSVGANGHVIANSIDVGPGGTITGGTITGGTIVGGTIKANTDISGATIHGNAISGGTLTGTEVSGTTIKSTDSGIAMLGDFPLGEFSWLNHISTLPNYYQEGSQSFWSSSYYKLNIYNTENDAKSTTEPFVFVGKAQSLLSPQEYALTYQKLGTLRIQTKDNIHIHNTDKLHLSGTMEINGTYTVPVTTNWVFMVSKPGTFSEGNVFDGPTRNSDEILTPIRSPKSDKQKYIGNYSLEMVGHTNKEPRFLFDSIIPFDQLSLLGNAPLDKIEVGVLLQAKHMSNFNDARINLSMNTIEYNASAFIVEDTEVLKSSPLNLYRASINSENGLQLKTIFGLDAGNIFNDAAIDEVEIAQMSLNSDSLLLSRFSENRDLSASTQLTADGLVIAGSDTGLDGDKLVFKGPGDNTGVSFDQYGNMHALPNAGLWRIYSSGGEELFHINLLNGDCWTKGNWSHH